MEQDEPTSYAALHFLVRHGATVALVFALAPVVAGAAAWLMGFHALFAVGGLVGGAFVYLIMRSYVELVRVIVDMLLPK
jgi:hypothetical protein